MTKKWFNKLGENIEYLKNDHKRLDEIPFDSSRKMMTTLNDFEGQMTVLTKGGLSEVIKHCNYVYKNGKVLKINKAIKNKYLLKEKAMSKKAYKVLALAYKPIETKKDFKIHIYGDGTSFEDCKRLCKQRVQQ